MLKTIIKKLASLFAKPEINAAQAWQATGEKTEHAFWLFAAPVTLLPSQDSFYMGDPAPVLVSHEESIALIESLNQHFVEDNYCFYLVNECWFLGLDSDPQMTVTHINEVKNKNVGHHLPQGEGALAWNKLQNEIQMLLFNHPVNEIREAQGLAVINSLWCYGLGASDK